MFPLHVLPPAPGNSMSRKPIPNFVNVAIQAHSVHVGVLVVKGETSAYHPYHPRPANQFILDDGCSSRTTPINPIQQTEQRMVAGYKPQNTKLLKYSLNILNQIDNLKPYTILFPKIQTRPSQTKAPSSDSQTSASTDTHSGKSTCIGTGINSPRTPSTSGSLKG